MRRPSVFLSHASADHRFALRLAQALTRIGLEVWYAPSHLKPGQDWHDEIGRALRRCTWFVVVLSPSGVRSKWVSRELRFALQQDRYVGHIVPVLYRACDEQRLSWTLAGSQRVDFTGEFAHGMTELRRIWKVRTTGRGGSR